MWFFIPLGFRYGDQLDSYSHLGNVFGPYGSHEAVEEALSRLYPNHKEDRFLVFEGEIVQVKPSSLEKPEHEKLEPGNIDNYIKDGDGYKCKDCGATILSARVAHPIHLREMPGSGFGECQYEDVPWCPNCERKPDFHGAPVLDSLG